jgi:hypothetical protein
VTDRRKTLAKASGASRGCGCFVAALGAGALLIGLFAVVWLVMSSRHRVSGPAEELGLTKGPSHGMDGWYVGVVNEHDVALAATYSFEGSGSTARTRSQEEIELVLRSDGSIHGAFVWTGDGFQGEGSWPAGWEARAARFARQYDSLEVRDAAGGLLPFDQGVVLRHTWHATRPSTADVQARIGALAEVVSLQ